MKNSLRLCAFAFEKKVGDYLFSPSKKQDKTNKNI